MFFKDKEAEDRSGLRIKEEIPVQWGFDDGTRSGLGVVRNISETGVCLEIEDTRLKLSDRILVLKALNEKHKNLIPEKALVRWYQIVAGNLRIGLEFVHPSNGVVQNIRILVQMWMDKVSKTSNINILNKYFPRRSDRAD